MSRRSFLLRQLAGMTVTVWVVLTSAFAFVSFTSDPTKFKVASAAAMSGQNATKAVNQYLAATNQNVPPLQRYVTWMGGVLRLDLGWSFSESAPVTSLLADHVAFTIVYFVPALAFAVVAGTGLRMYTAAAEGTRFDGLSDSLSYVAVSVPVFLLAYAVKWWVLPRYYVLTGDQVAYYAAAGPLAPQNLQAAVFPAAAMALFLFGIQLRYAGTEFGKHASAAFVKTVRGKGAGVWRVGRHIFRNVAVELLLLFFTDMLGMVVIAVVVVEAIAGVPGFGALTLTAMKGSHDLPLMVGVSLLPVLLGVVANFAQEIGHALFYPQVDVDE